MDEFIPLQHFYRLARLWWLLVLTTLAGAAVGYIFHRLQPPIYEAVASMNATIDIAQFDIMTDISKDKLIYNEDLALSVIDQAFHSTEAYQTVLIRSTAAGLPIPDVNALYANHTLERRHGNWLFYYRHSDPQVAQAVADIWAQVAYENMMLWLATGVVPDYISVQTPVDAPTPAQPVDFELNKLVMAGSLIGLIAGILLANVLAQRINVKPPESSQR
jgi:hypothetical protein